MICMFTHEPCKYISCPLWSERHQGCRFVLAINKILEEEKSTAQLTLKEQYILDLMSQGYSNQQISDASKLGISTVKNHITQILRKLGAKNRVEAVVTSLANNECNYTSRLKLKEQR